MSQFSSQYQDSVMNEYDTVYDKSQKVIFIEAIWDNDTTVAIWDNGDSLWDLNQPIYL